MRIVDCEQGTPEWFMARRGLPTASCFNKILTPAKMDFSKQAVEYIDELVAESMMQGAPLAVESYGTRMMQHGTDTEPEARDWYEFENDVDVREVGLCIHDSGLFGGSPDGLVGEDGGMELKCPLPKTHIKYLRVGKLPNEYKLQVHGLLLVTGRKWWDFVSYCQKLPPFQIRVTPDETTSKLETALFKFAKQLEEAKETLGVA